MGSCSLSAQVRGPGEVVSLSRSWGLACSGCAANSHVSIPVLPALCWA